MMRFSTLLIIVLLFRLAVFSQHTTYTSIQQTKKAYPDRNFFTVKIIDNRQNKENIGYVYKTSRVKRYPADFKKDIKKEILAFLSKTFPNKRSKNRILLVVNGFEIGHHLSETKEDSGFVKVDFDFYRLTGDSAFFLYNFKKQVTDVSESVELSHGNRMKRVILNAFAPMDTTITKTRNANTNVTTVTTLLKNAVTFDYKVLTKKDSIEASYYPPYYLLLLGANVNGCSSYAIAGLNANLLFQLKKHSRYLIGLNGNFFLYGFFNKRNLPPHADYSLFNYDFGLKLLRQIKGNLFLNINPQLILGKEKIITGNTVSNAAQPFLHQEEITRQIFGLQLDLGLCYIPIKHTGIFYGADLFLKTCSSSIFDTNAGIKINFGMKF